MTTSLFEGAHMMGDPIEFAFLAGAITALRRRAARQVRIAADGTTSGSRNAVIRQGESAVALRVARGAERARRRARKGRAVNIAIPPSQSIEDFERETERELASSELPPGKTPPVKFTPTPFTWRDPSTFPRRQFVYGRHYARQFLSVTAAPTKVGKSSKSLVEAVAMASGRNLLGVEPVRPMRVWYWNGEDPREEHERRVLAICLHYGIDGVELEKSLFLDSGRETEIIIATQAGREPSSRCRLRPRSPPRS